ncbi:proline dehydrogenase family protein [Myceligenerans salitolerans]|uniref:L-glutamate gamma-semialdehyde dehydrogenase n=1 Tax=Myceligenerans salitolerans TaxID=1230528 RepID=A0ABS3I867_9MICO|nr:proline dehydrogenase family protein [Myceligenerans salitolerans]MBO0609206.1 proline dehydrogenase family protein [Myceligenerans salitolerans]
MKSSAQHPRAVSVHDDVPAGATNAAVSAESLADDAVALARRWIRASERRAAHPSAADRAAARASESLSALVSDPAGLELAMSFVDDVARPQDSRVAAKALARLGSQAGSATFLGPVDRLLFRAGALAAPLAPAVVVPAARARLKQLVGHLVADAGPGLTAHLSRTRAQGYTLNVNLLGEAVLGEAEAAARLRRTIGLVERPDVDYVSVKVSSVAAQLVTWDLPGSRDRVVEHLVPLYRAAREHGVFVNLDMEEYRDLALTTEVFKAVLDRDEFRGLEAGIVLQASLPDAQGALDDLTAFAQKRVASGGARIKVRLVKGANLSMERVEAALHDWPQAPYPTKPDVDANYVRLLNEALRPDRTAAVRIGAASHNLYHVALAVLLARGRGVADALDIEMLQGMAPAESAAVRDEITPDGGRVVLYTPVVRDEDFDVAISYLVRRLEENATRENFVYAMFAGAHEAGSPADPMDLQEAAFRASVADGVHYEPSDVAPRRVPRDALPGRPGTGTPGNGASTAAAPEGGMSGTAPADDSAGFRNAVDTDPAVAASRDWAARVIGERSGFVPAITSPLATIEQVDDVVATAGRATAAWSRVSPADRARVLRAAARHLEAARTDLVAAAVHEAGKTVAEVDPEISEAVDFAAYYAVSAERLDPSSAAYPGAEFHAGGVTLVTPPWNFPVAIPIGGVLAALAAGSAVIAKPAPPTPRCYELAVEAVHAALDEVAPEIGLDPAVARDVVQYVRVPDGDLGRRLVTHDGVARVVLTGAIETAEMFASWRPGLQILAETSGKNALVVTPSSDLDLAVADVVRSAFGHAGQKCSAASLVILVGSVGDPKSVTGERFRRQLVDAVRSLAVGPATSLSTVMGPLTEPAQGKLLRALTTLEPGESWLVRPRRLDAVAREAGLAHGRLWTPGVREGVRPGSFFHLTEVFGPVLGIMTARTLDEAIELQNAVSFGLTGGLHSLDEAEIDHWLDRVEVGNAYVNRHITGAIVQRQSFGGWKASSVGPGAKAGGPNYVAQLGTWSDSADVPSRDEDPDGWLAVATADDERWWAREFGVEHDPTGLEAESNVFRYRPVPGLTVRVGDGAREVEVKRVLAAAERAGVPVDVSRTVGGDTPPAGTPRTAVGHLTHDEFAEAVADGLVTGRIRVIGEAPGLREAATSRLATVTVLDEPVLASGRRELLTMLREQAISRTMHRYGHIRR